jgi:uncharacterized membrane protein
MGSALTDMELSTSTRLAKATGEGGRKSLLAADWVLVLLLPLPVILG